MFYFLYLVLIPAIYPTIPSDLKGLASDQFNVREAATKRLESLPGWIAPYFNYYASNSKDAEVRIRCMRIYVSLSFNNRKAIEKFCIEIGRHKMNIAVKNTERKRVATIIANLSKLSSDDLKLAEEQKVCPFHEGFSYVTLGEMGVPVKIIVKGQPILLCCKDCIKNAKANPNKTLAQIKEVKKQPEGRYPFLTKEQLQKVKDATSSSDNKR
jgi:hypothetical protein